MPVTFCDKGGMVKPSPKELVEASGISQSYAHMILNDGGNSSKSRTPPRSLAIVIYRATNWRHPVIADLTEDQMTVLEQVDPWTPPKDRQEAA